MEYIAQMQSLITKTTINIIITLFLVTVIIAIVWTAVFLYYKKSRKADNDAKKFSLISPAVLTVICLLFSLSTIPSFQDIGNMKKDIKDQAFVTYVGDYDIDSTYRFTFSASELWFDLRTVTVKNDNEPLWFDMTRDIDTDIHDTGTIIYGKNSRFIVSIENNN